MKFDILLSIIPTMKALHSSIVIEMSPSVGSHCQCYAVLFDNCQLQSGAPIQYKENPGSSIPNLDWTHPSQL